MSIPNEKFITASPESRRFLISITLKPLFPSIVIKFVIIIRKVWVNTKKFMWLLIYSYILSRPFHIHFFTQSTIFSTSKPDTDMNDGLHNIFLKLTHSFLTLHSPLFLLLRGKTVFMYELFECMLARTNDFFVAVCFRFYAFYVMVILIESQ